MWGSDRGHRSSREEVRQRRGHGTVVSSSPVEFQQQLKKLLLEYLILSSFTNYKVLKVSHKVMTPGASLWTMMSNLDFSIYSRNLMGVHSIPQRHLRNTFTVLFPEVIWNCFIILYSINKFLQDQVAPSFQGHVLIIRALHLFRQCHIILWFTWLSPEYVLMAALSKVILPISICLKAASTVTSREATVFTKEYKL